MGAVFRLFGWMACCAALATAPAIAADYPDRPIRLIVPQAAGSATDTTARILAAELGIGLGQQIIVDNRPGGALTLGLDLVAKSSPDGYTLGMGPIGALAITRHMVDKLPYDIERDFLPVALVTRGHLMLAVTPSLPVKSVAELIAYAKKNPGKLSNASSSNGSPGHVGGELFKFMTGTDIVHVPYKGGSQAINDLIAGHVQVMFESLQSISPFAKSGAVRALAVSGAKRSPAFPDLPTVGETVPGYEAATFTGVIAPAVRRARSSISSMRRSTLRSSRRPSKRNSRRSATSPAAGRRKISPCRLRKIPANGRTS